MPPWLKTFSLPSLRRARNHVHDTLRFRRLTPTAVASSRECLMKPPYFRCFATVVLRPRVIAAAAGLLLLFPGNLLLAQALLFVGAPDNDLVAAARAAGWKPRVLDTPRAAVDAATPGDGVLLLADGYPNTLTPVDADLFRRAAAKRLRLYVEYPSFLPGLSLGAPRGTQWERAVAASDAFAPALSQRSILSIHGCRFIPTSVPHADLVLGRVAGFDTAVYGWPPDAYPILFTLPAQAEAGDVLVATTKLSHFLTGRYAPTESWRAVWGYILHWLQPSQAPRHLPWVASVRPTLGRSEPASPHLEKQALRRGIDWYFSSRMLVHPSMLAKYRRPANEPVAAVPDPDVRTDWPYGHRTALRPSLQGPTGDGSLGVLEGFDAKIFADGTQPVRWWIRNDCNGEIAGAMAAAGRALKSSRYSKTGGRIGDWLYFRSMMSIGDRADPLHPAYGLFGWNDTPQYCGPGSMDGFAVYYGDDNARSMLGMMLAAAVLPTDRFDERLMRGLLANLRLSGQTGFQPDRVDQGPLEQAGWKTYFEGGHTSFSPHYQAMLWACYLWAYQHTGFELFHRRALSAIQRTMAAYPDRWVWTNGMQQERAKMLLALAWLIRVDDSPEHRGWLRRIADDLLAHQDACGAIREQLGPAGKGSCPPPASNEAYGTAEAPLIQSNEDAACDLLYTSNFAFLALHEAAAATRDPLYQAAENKLADFLCRIQIRSETHPELDGGWFRAFDLRRWEYWASSTDLGWGAWCIESGWTQSWITSVLALRRLHTSLWDCTSRTEIDRHFLSLRRQMLPDALLAPDDRLDPAHAPTRAR